MLFPVAPLPTPTAFHKNDYTLKDTDQCAKTGCDTETMVGVATGVAPVIGTFLGRWAAAYRAADRYTSFMDVRPPNGW